MEKTKINCIEKIKEIYSWMEYNTFTTKTNENNEKYILIKFTDKVCGKIILWIYVYENKSIKLEFRDAFTTNIQHQFEYEDYKSLVKDIDNIKYLY